MKNKFRLHLLGLPHTVTNKSYSACAFTMKCWKMGKMMLERGHEVIYYGHPDSDIPCTEKVTVITDADLLKAYGNYDWRRNFFKHSADDHAHKTFNANAIVEVGKRKKPYDFLLPFWGWGVWPVCEAHNDMIVVEPGIGYPTVTPARWKVFESYAIYHAYCGMQAVGTCKQDWYEVIIPNYFDPEDFTFSKEKDDYFLFMGRIYSGKGIDVAIQVTEKLGKKLIVAGQMDGSITEFPKHVEYVGYANVEMRRILMSRATASFIPSMYLEPFCGVGVENLFSGTPIISTDWGVFSEYNKNGKTGYRCRTFKDFLEAAHNVKYINPYDCRKIAMDNYSLDAVAPQYEKYFQDVLNVYTGEGWYQL